MYTFPRPEYLRRSVITRPPVSNVYTATNRSHAQRIKSELIKVGVSRVGLMRLGSKYLPRVIHDDEHLGGVVYGQHDQGSVILIATDRRVVFLDKKPLFMNMDEIRYEVVSGVRHSHVGFLSTVTLHTRIKDYRIRTFNHRCALNFVRFIESRCLEYKFLNQGEQDYFM